MLKLYNFERSPFGWKTRLVLAEKNIPYESIEPRNKMEDPGFARLNPFRLTPVLELEDGRTIYEHLARLDSELSGRTWFSEIFSLADAALAPPLTGMLRLLGILPDQRYPNILAWTRRIAERPSYLASAPKQPLSIKES